MNYSYTQAREEHYRDECSHYDYMQEAYGPSAPDPLYEYYCSIEFEGTFREFKASLLSKQRNIEPTTDTEYDSTTDTEYNSTTDTEYDSDCPF